MHDLASYIAAALDGEITQIFSNSKDEAFLIYVCKHAFLLYDKNDLCVIHVLFEKV